MCGLLCLRSKRTLPPIVTPDWVVESIKAGRVLALDRFLLTRLTVDHPGQLRLTAFAAQRPALQLKPVGQGAPGASAGGTRAGASLANSAERDAQLVAFGAGPRSTSLASPVGERPSGGARPSSELEANAWPQELDGSREMTCEGGHPHETQERGDEGALVQGTERLRANHHTAEDSAPQDRDADQDRNQDQVQDRIQDQALAPLRVPQGDRAASDLQAERPGPSLEQNGQESLGGQPHQMDGRRGSPAPASAPAPVLRPCSGDSPQKTGDAPARLDHAGHQSGPARSHSTLEDPNFVQNYFKVSIHCPQTRGHLPTRKSVQGLIPLDAVKEQLALSLCLDMTQRRSHWIPQTVYCILSTAAVLAAALYRHMEEQVQAT